MDMNVNLNEKLKGMPEDIRYLANMLLKDIDNDKKSTVKMQEDLLKEISDIIEEEQE